MKEDTSVRKWVFNKPIRLDTSIFENNRCKKQTASQNSQYWLQEDFLSGRRDRFKSIDFCDIPITEFAHTTNDTLRDPRYTRNQITTALSDHPNLDKKLETRNNRTCLTEGLDYEDQRMIQNNKYSLIQGHSISEIQEQPIRISKSMLRRKFDKQRKNYCLSSQILEEYRPKSIQEAMIFCKQRDLQKANNQDKQSQVQKPSRNMLIKKDDFAFNQIRNIQNKQFYEQKVPKIFQNQFDELQLKCRTTKNSELLHTEQRLVTWKDDNTTYTKWQPEGLSDKDLSINKQEQLLQKAMAKIKLVRVLQMVIKNKFEYKNALKQMNNDHLLQEAYVNDPTFQSQLENVMPNTKFIMNKLLKDVDQRYEIDYKHEERIRDKKANLLKNFKAGFQRLLKQNQANRMESHNELSEFSQHLLKDCGKQSIKPLNQQQNSKIKVKYIENKEELKPIVGIGNIHTQRIRKLIQKHFCTGFPHSLRQRQGDNNNFNRIIKIGNLKRAIDKCFTFARIGEAYQNLEMNMYSYDYINEMRLIDGVKKEKLKDLHPLRQTHNIPQIFKKQVAKEQFYGEIKKNAHNFLTYMKPSLLYVNNNQLSLHLQTINDYQASIMRQFLEKTEDQKNQVLSFIIDECKITDEAFANILYGICQQTNPRGQTKLYRLVISNVGFGPQTITAMCELLPKLNEIWLNNIQINMNKKVAKDVLEGILDNADHLYKLRLSNVDLHEEKTFKSLLNVLEYYMSELTTLNLSNCCLHPHQLVSVSKLLKRNHQIIKTLDLSFNTLNKKNEGVIHHNKQFIANMNKFFTKTNLLNHLDMSGMNLEPKSIISLCETLCCCPNLMSIHLNDNGIMFESNKNVFRELLQIFDLADIDFDKACRNKRVSDNMDNKQIREILSLQLMVNESKELKTKGDKVQKKLLRSLSASINDSLKEIQKQKTLKEMNQNHQMLLKEKNGYSMQVAIEERNQKMLELIEKTENEQQIFNKIPQKINKKLIPDLIQRINYKNQLLKFKKARVVKQQQLDVQTQLKNGIGRSDGSNIDPFVITRVINNPELVWNQDTTQDLYPQNRFFQVDTALKWKLSQKSECYICDGWKYTAIIFKKGLFTKENHGLHEVKDKAFLKEMDNHYQYNYSKDQTYTPVICGSVVDGNNHTFPFSRMRFERKLRLMRVEIYCGLLLSQSGHYIKNKNESQKIKQGLVEYSKKDQYQELQAIDLVTKLDDWTKIFKDKLLNNQLTDLHLENVDKNDFVNWESDLFKKDNYIYANYLPTGEHKLLIYCPTNKKAFVKTFYVGINTKDFYPEWPICYEVPRFKLILNIWRNSQKLGQEDKRAMCRGDIQIESFDLSLIIKNSDQLAHVKEEIRNQYDKFIIVFKELQSLDMDTYPKLGFDQVMSLNQNIEQNSELEIPIQKEQLELQFIRTCRNQEQNNLKGTLDRSEFIEYIVRVSKSAFPLMISGLSLLIVITSYLDTVIKQSKFEQEKKLIRDSKPLNKLLYENKHGLTYIFNKLSDFSPAGIEKQHLGMYFSKLFRSDPGLELSPNIFHKMFVYSQEYVFDDKREQPRYFYLSYESFLEIIARIAIEIYKNQDKGIEYKYYQLLDLIYQFEKIKTPKQGAQKDDDIDISLKPIDEDEECG